MRPAALALLLPLLACAPDEGPRVGGPARQQIRPTDGAGWNNNGYGNVTVAHHDTPGGRFRLHYTLEGVHKVPAYDTDGSGAPDFVEAFGKVFDQVYALEVSQLGFRPPLGDDIYHDRPDYGGDGRFDVYLQDQGKSADGYIVVEACKPEAPYQCAGYMVVENDFIGFPYPSQKDGMEVLASHEFFHVVQNAYRTNLPRTFTEATAVWITERVFPQQTDFEKFLPHFFQSPDRSLDHELGSPSDLFPYGLAVWPTFLAERYGEALLPAVFDELSELGSSTNDLDAIDKVLARDHQDSLAGAFATFALWNLLTGKRAVGSEGYAAAASYPELSEEAVSGSLPLRITDEIAYLSAHYYRVAVPKGRWVRVVSERPQPQLALHLVTWPEPGKGPRVASATPAEGQAEIESAGEITVIAASTARKDRSLPLSLAVTEFSPPAPPPPPPDNGESSTSGCAWGGPAAVPPWTTLLLLLLPLAALGRGRRLLPLLVALLLPAGCSDTRDPRPDLAVDAMTPDAPAAPDGPVPLAVGQFVDFDADANGQIFGGTPVGGNGQERYILLLLSRDSSALKEHDYTAAEITATSGVIVSGGHQTGLELPGGFQRCRFSERLHQLLATHPRRLTAPQRHLYATQPPQVGDKRGFEIQGDTGQPVTITAEAVWVDGTTAFWLDRTTQPLAAIDPTALQELAEGFGKVVVPRERVYFGHESDVDGDGLVSVLLSPLVAASAVAYVSPCDLVDPTLVPGCPISNGMELLYMTPPSSLQPPYNTSQALLEIAAHELQHAIYFYRKYVLHNNVGAAENPYLTEGLSALAQDLSGYQAGNLYVVMATLKSIDLVAVPNLVDEAVSSYVPPPADGVMRGGGYLLLRYLFDQAGGDAMDAAGTPVDKGGIAWLRAFVDAKETGGANVTQASKQSLADIAERFWTAMALSNRGPGGSALTSDPRFNFLPTTTDPLTQRQRGCNLFAPFHGMQLVGPATQTVAGADGKLRAGGAELLTLAAKAGSASLAFEVKTTAAAAARLRLIRVK